MARVYRGNITVKHSLVFTDVFLLKKTERNKSLESKCLRKC